MRLVALVFAAACASAQPAPPTIANKVVAGPGGVITITGASFGPIDARSKATLVGLRALFVGYEVKPNNDGTLEYDVYLAGEKLLFVVPNDNEATVFNVHAVSPKVSVADRDWRVGGAFHDVSTLTDCECWGPNPTCFKAGEHVALNFKRACDGLTEGTKRRLNVLEGAEIQRVIWSPQPFGASGGDDEEDSAGYP